MRQGGEHVAAFIAPGAASSLFTGHKQTIDSSSAGYRCVPFRDCNQLDTGVPAVAALPTRISPRCTLGFGFSPPSQRDGNRGKALPDAEKRCACGSERPYGKCCRRFHTAQGTPQVAEDLLRSRYSAYAYRLPSYIMKTTHSSLAELDRRKWKYEIMQFSEEYQFVGGVDVIELQNPGPNTTRILFRANLMERNVPMSFVEMSTFVRERNIWYYKSGKLVNVEDDS